MIILCDDLGRGDVPALAEGYETPHLERMAADGIRFTSFYAAQPVCSALRAERPEVLERLMELVEAAREDLGDKLTNRPGANRREPGRWRPP